MIVPIVGTEIPEETVSNGMVIVDSAVSGGTDYILDRYSVAKQQPPCASEIFIPTLLACSHGDFLYDMLSIVVTLSRSRYW